MNLDLQTGFNIAFTVATIVIPFLWKQNDEKIKAAKTEGIARAVAAEVAAIARAELAEKNATARAELAEKNAISKADAAGLLAEAARQQALAIRDEERQGRERDRHELRDDIQKVAARLAVFEIEVAKECINSERLATALAPMNAGIDEIKTDMRELFNRVDQKMDKRPGGD